MKLFPPFTLELTFALIKPHVLRVPPLADTIRNEMLENGFFIVRSNFCNMTKNHIRRLYDEHFGKPYYQRLTTSMCSGPVESYILAREDAIRVWRNMLGPTKALVSQFTHATSLRGRFGLSDVRNVAHGADSAESVIRECEIFFPEFCVSKWFEEEEKYYRNGFVTFCEENYVHSICYDRSTDLTLERFSKDDSHDE